MKKDGSKILCETPTPGKQPTRIDKWKYDLIRSAILKVLPGNKPGVEFNKLSGQLNSIIPSDQLNKIGSLPWYTTTVKLDLEVKGEIERIPGSNPQRLRKI